MPIKPGSLHVLGHVVLTCASLGEVAGAAVRYHPLVSQAGTVSLERGGEATRIRYRPTVDPATMHPQQVEAIIAGIVRAARWVAGDDWAPLSVSFTHARAGSAEPYARVLGRPVAFDAPENALTVAHRDLDRPRAPHDPELGACTAPTRTGCCASCRPPSPSPSGSGSGWSTRRSTAPASPTRAGAST
ncbi:AraC family transcriptional regulator [Streptomyces sp. NPDC085639]|uniref:AraC family transcriptional regulator n=1 Tax=Streptomyces sp. NPDC085639 TaxID=3365734 RepID=UPI0037D86217